MQNAIREADPAEPLSLPQDRDLSRFGVCPRRPASVRSNQSLPTAAILPPLPTFNLSISGVLQVFTPHRAAKLDLHLVKALEVSDGQLGQHAAFPVFPV